MADKPRHWLTYPGQVARNPESATSLARRARQVKTPRVDRMAQKRYLETQGYEIHAGLIDWSVKYDGQVIAEHTGKKFMHEKNLERAVIAAWTHRKKMLSYR